MRYLLFLATLLSTLISSAQFRNPDEYMPSSPVVKTLSKVNFYWYEAFEIDILDKSAITLTIDGGEPIQNLDITSDDIQLEVVFPSGLPAGDYCLTIGAGAIRVDYETNPENLVYNWKVLGNDTELANPEITCDPADGSTLKAIDKFSVTFEGVSEVEPIWSNGSASSPYAVMWGGNRNNVLRNSCSVEGNTATMSLRSPISDPGEYTIYLPEGCFLLDGKLNAEKTLTYTVAEQEIVVTPEGDTFTELDAIYVTFPGIENVTIVEEGMAFIYTSSFSPIYATEARTEGNQLIITYPGGFPDGEYMLNIYGGIIALDGVVMQRSQFKLKEFKVEANPAPEISYTVEPEEERLAVLDQITITVNNAQTVTLITDEFPFVTSGSKIFKGEVSVEGNVITITFPEPLSDGEYTVTIYGGVITIDGEPKEDKTVLKTYIVDHTVGISEIYDADPADTTIYTISGRRATSMEPGHIYIVNGKKILK